MPNTSAPTKASPKNMHRGWRVAVYLSVFVGVALVLTFIVLMFGRVEGVEFSPARFETRRFTVHEIPLLKIQVSPIRRTTSQSSTARYLVAQSLIQLPATNTIPSKQPRLQPPPKVQATEPEANTSTKANAPTKPAAIPDPWHLVMLTRGGVSSRPADAKLLTDQLEFNYYHHYQSNEYWHDWSIKEPAKAKVFWPIIQKLALRELYILMPTLFSLAMDSQDAATLRVSIDEYLRRSYAELVVEMRSAGREELASELLSEAIADFPNDKKLQALR